MSKDSIGHRFYLNGYEYFVGHDGCLYMANANNPLDVKGYRQGARFECMPSHIDIRVRMLHNITANNQYHF